MMLIANWKMQLTDSEARALAERVRTFDCGATTLVVCPSFTALAGVADVLRGSAVALGAQDCGPDARGAYTGSMSPADLAALGCRYVLVGHSERRAMGEGDAVIAAKLRAAAAAGLAPILCVGETADERRAGARDAVIARQVRTALAGCDARTVGTLTVAYEPVWAVGTGDPATPADASAAAMHIASDARVACGDASPSPRVVYGGSVDAANVAVFARAPGISGALVGGSSQTAEGLRGLLAALTAV